MFLYVFKNKKKFDPKVLRNFYKSSFWGQPVDAGIVKNGMS